MILNMDMNMAFIRDTEDDMESDKDRDTDRDIDMDMGPAEIYAYGPNTYPWKFV